MVSYSIGVCIDPDADVAALMRQVLDILTDAGHDSAEWWPTLWCMPDLRARQPAVRGVDLGGRLSTGLTGWSPRPHRVHITVKNVEIWRETMSRQKGP